MPNRFRAHWITLCDHFRYSHPLALLPWSSIRRVGQSRLLALTIIVPFVGSLLLFNHHVVELLTLSPEVVGRWLHVDVSPQDAAKQLTFSRLYFVYFGLSFLGIGSAMFALLCPIDIKNNGSIREYLDAEDEFVTRARMGLIIPNIAKQYTYYHGNDELDELPSFTARLSEADKFTSLFVQVITEIYLALQRHEVPEGDVDRSALPEDEFADHRGRPIAGKISVALYMGTGANQYLVHEVQDIAALPAHRNDILTLQYLALDHSRAWSRLIVRAFYGAGFILLFIPTLLTFVRLTSQLIWQ